MAQGWLLGGVIGSDEGGDAGMGKDKRNIEGFCFSATAAAAPSTVSGAGAIHVSSLKTLRAYQPASTTSRN